MKSPVPSQERPRARTRSVRVPLGLGANPHIVFLALLKQARLPTPSTETRFAPPRRWRFDYSWETFDHRSPGTQFYTTGVALEVEGGAYTHGRHTRGKGFIADMAKYNEAAIRGWIVLRVTPQQLCSPDTITLLKRALNV